MIPASLAIAICIGAASALLLGITIELSGDGGALVHTEGPAITLVAESGSHAAGDDILVTLYNSGSVGVDFGGGTYYGIRVTQLDGILVYMPPSDEGSSHLGAGQSAQIVWDQRRAGGEQIHSGIYRILAEGTTVDGSKVADSTTVSIG